MSRLSQENNWQFKFSQICQDIRDIKSNNNSSSEINNQKMTITPTQLGSTSILSNHKLQDSYNYVKDEQDDTCSPYKPLPDPTKVHNSGSPGNCERSLSYTMTTPLPEVLLLPSYPAPVPSSKTPQWQPSSASPSDEMGDIVAQYELPVTNDTSVLGVLGPIGEEGGEESLRAESNQLETMEVLTEGGPPNPGPLGGTSGPSGAPEPSPPDPNKTAVRRNLINESS